MTVLFILSTLLNIGLCICCILLCNECNMYERQIKAANEMLRKLAPVRRSIMCNKSIASGVCPKNCERCAWSEIPYQRRGTEWNG